MSYEELPFMKPEDFARCTYGKAADCRDPIRGAINSARMMRPTCMEEVRTVLQTALDWIDQREEEDETDKDLPDESVGSSNDSNDPLDGLLGPAGA